MIRDYFELLYDKKGVLHTITNGQHVNMLLIRSASQVEPDAIAKTFNLNNISFFENCTTSHDDFARNAIRLSPAEATRYVD